MRLIFSHKEKNYRAMFGMATAALKTADQKVWWIGTQLSI